MQVEGNWNYNTATHPVADPGKKRNFPFQHGEKIEEMAFFTKIWEYEIKNKKNKKLPKLQKFSNFPSQNGVLDPPWHKLRQRPFLIYADKILVGNLYLTNNSQNDGGFTSKSRHSYHQSLWQN